MSYSDFKTLFGVKKHELDRSQLVMLVTKYLETLELYSPNQQSDDLVAEELILK